MVSQALRTNRIAALCRRRRGATTPRDLAAHVGTRALDNTPQPLRPQGSCWCPGSYGGGLRESAQRLSRGSEGSV